MCTFFKHSFTMTPRVCSSQLDVASVRDSAKGQVFCVINQQCDMVYRIRGVVLSLEGYSKRANILGRIG